MRIPPLIAMAFAASFGVAQASVTQYSAQGVFSDGESLSGSFFLDNAQTLPGSMFGSTLRIGGSSPYSQFIGAHAPVGALPNTMLDIEFLGAGILDLQVSADYDLSSGLVHAIRNGAFGTSALYAAGSADTFLVSGSISAVDEPASMAVLGLGVAIAVGVSRRRDPVAIG